MCLCVCVCVCVCESVNLYTCTFALCVCVFVCRYEFWCVRIVWIGVYCICILYTVFVYCMYTVYMHFEHWVHYHSAAKGRWGFFWVVCDAWGFGARVTWGSVCCWHCQKYVEFPVARAPGFCVVRATWEAPPIFGSSVFECVSMGVVYLLLYNRYLLYFWLLSKGCSVIVGLYL